MWFAGAAVEITSGFTGCGVVVGGAELVVCVVNWAAGFTNSIIGLFVFLLELKKAYPPAVSRITTQAMYKNNDFLGIDFMTIIRPTSYM